MMLTMDVLCATSGTNRPPMSSVSLSSITYRVLPPSAPSPTPDCANDNHRARASLYNAGEGMNVDYVNVRAGAGGKQKRSGGVVSR